MRPSRSIAQGSAGHEHRSRLSRPLHPHPAADGDSYPVEIILETPRRGQYPAGFLDVEIAPGSRLPPDPVADGERLFAR
jgi:hypothetical protein